MFIPNLLNLIPKAALAAILIFTGYKLAKLSIFKDYYKKGWEQFMPFMITVLAIVFTDLLKGVLIGIAVGIFYIIRSNFRSAIYVEQQADSTLIRMRKDVSFFSKPILKAALENLEKGTSVIIDMTSAEFIDKDILDTIIEFNEHAHLKGIQVEIKRTIYNDSSKIKTSASQVREGDAAH
jgi:MFS superfamily sulfate permease-like transporter